MFPTRKHNHLIRKLIFSAIIFIIPLNSIAHADAWLPMIAIDIPPLLLALLPVIYIETYVWYRILKTFGFREIQKPIAFANIFSTILGFPLTWLALIITRSLVWLWGCGPGFHGIANQILTTLVEFTWLCPWKIHPSWYLPTVFLANMIIAYFVSVASEYYVLWKHLPDINKKTLLKISWIANSITYPFLILLSLIFWVP